MEWISQKGFSRRSLAHQQLHYLFSLQLLFSTLWFPLQCDITYAKGR
ncbi:unnamed protein product, partial [Allacma fusca]